MGKANNKSIIFIPRAIPIHRTHSLHWPTGEFHYWCPGLASRWELLSM